MKGLFYRIRTIRELKAIVRNLSTQIKQVTRKFSKALGIYCSWSRMNKKQLIKVVDWFLGNYSIEAIVYSVSKPSENVYTAVDPAPTIKDIVDDLKLNDFDGFIAYNMLHPYKAKNFTVKRIYLDPDFEEKYFDEYVYDENGWIVVNRWLDNGGKIGNKRRTLIGCYVALIQENDNFLVFDILPNNIIRKYHNTINAKYFDNLNLWYHAKTNKSRNQNKAVA